MSCILDRFSAIAGRYRVLLCDIWGVVHNGVAAFPAACEALVRFRAEGGSVVLITNAPRPAASVMRQIARLGVPLESYDAIVSSGDVTRGVIARRPGETVFHLGPERDRSIFTGLEVSFRPAETADYVVCSGLFDDTVETPEDYRALLTLMRGRELFMVCANPDVVVERGDTLVYCAGALADAYRTLGGDVLYTGKPYRPIYEKALALAAAARSGDVALVDVLAIGDSIRTDLAGAAALGVDFVFVTGGIHAEELGSREEPDAAALSDAFAAAGASPVAVMRRLVW